jgi:hypothetical protein
LSNCALNLGLKGIVGPPVIQVMAETSHKKGELLCITEFHRTTSMSRSTVVQEYACPGVRMSRSTFVQEYVCPGVHMSRSTFVRESTLVKEYVCQEVRWPRSTYVHKY